MPYSVNENGDLIETDSGSATPKEAIQKRMIKMTNSISDLHIEISKKRRIFYKLSMQLKEIEDKDQMKLFEDY